MRSLSQDFKSKRPLLINPSQAEAFLERCASVEIPMAAKMTDMGEMLAAIFGAKQTLEKFPPFAIVPVKGVIGANLSELESMCGCCDISDVEEMLEECERDPAIKTIILDIDSPGGTSVGVPELANRIKNSKKEVISFTASECCSAAYWIGSQANAGFYATGSSTVGSVGVYIAYPDCSEAYKMEGVRMEVIKSGLFKGAGIPGTSLDANQRKMLQDEVNEIHGEFKMAVKGVREFVDDASMEGQTFSGKKAAEAGMVTGLVNGFDEMMESLNSAVAAQMEADEENDERQECAEGVGHKAEEDEGDEYGTSRMASDRALLGIKANVLKASAAKMPAKVKADEESEDEKNDGVAPQPKGEEGEEGKGDIDAKDKAKDPTDPDDPEYDPDEDPSLKAKAEPSTEKADAEADAGEKAVDTDSDTDDKSKHKRNKSRGVA
ncbi:S49 family peptidase [Sphingorhabdus sp.]|uniref:S49 family peptidase n=1 Tax=Sphingorhabdus sp. TaxID=1902408 RepID=UPI00334044BA